MYDLGYIICRNAFARVVDTKQVRLAPHVQDEHDKCVAAAWKSYEFGDYTAVQLHEELAEINATYN